MDAFAGLITRHKKLVITLFVLLALGSVGLWLFVDVNYDMADYLPPEAQSTKAIEIMEQEFGGSMPNASVMVKDVSVQQALEYKNMLVDVDGVSEVMWLDDAADIKQPIEMMDKATVENFYKDRNALFTVTIEEGREKDVSAAIWQLIGDNNALAGSAPNIAAMQEATGAEVMNAMLILIPLAIVILMVFFTSWAEPILIFISMIVSVLINMGTNVFFGQISFMTNSVSPILQMAVSLDYAIFLLHSFHDHRKKAPDVDTAMRMAIKESVTTVSASALTTFFGFLALAFMKFRIGADLGLILVKGIVISFVCTMSFLPALTLTMHKLVDKTAHRSFLPSFKGLNRLLTRLTIPAVLAVAIILVPSFLGQQRTPFVYGNSGIASNGVHGGAAAEIEDEFGKQTIMALLLPRGDISKEWELGKDLEDMPYVKSVVSYANTVGTVFPPEFVGESVTSQFYSDNYARLVVYTDTPDEGDEAFKAVEEITAAAKGYYGDNVYSAGQSANLYDMKTVVEVDNRTVNLIAIIAIFFVLLLTFRSATLPVILLLTIETGIWINLSIPYFAGTSINFIGYLVLSTVQLGATVDYAILLTDTYLKKRKKLPKKEALDEAMGSSFKSIMVSAGILAAAGFTLYGTSTNPSVRDIGLLLGRGTILSFVMVVVFLPAMLRLFDRLIGKTTLKADFYALDDKPKKGKEASDEV